ncbi:MAG: 2TM domain-containing protein [Chloroflexota bacterium]|nr:2TM domain-containing protein [Chloroflexota bacterium]
MAHQPSRPFESLEWYRDAARNNFRDDDPRKGLAKWASGFGMLHAHVSLFAVGIVVLLAINLIRTPEDIWSGQWIMAWTVLLLLHAVVIGFVWAMQQWNGDAPDEALLMAPAREREQPSAFNWGLNGSEAQDVDFRVTTETRASSPSPAPDPVEDPSWMGWNAAAEDEDPPGAERASWKEASAAAWLDRPRPGADGNHEPDTKRNA